MRIEPYGFYRIVANNKIIEFSLNQMECSLYSGNEYFDHFETFDYAKIFKNVLENIQWDKEKLPSGINLKDYSIPANRKEFNQSSLWTDLGFNCGKEFEIVQICKEIKINYEASYGQGALTLIDFVDEEVYHYSAWVIQNALDDYIFDWGSFYEIREEGLVEIGGSEALDKLVQIYKNYDDDSVEEKVREYMSNFYHETDSDFENVISESRITEEEIMGIVNIMKEKP